MFEEVEDYPGMRETQIYKDYIAKYQVTSTYFYSAYPDASVRDIRKALKIERGFDVIARCDKQLDTKTKKWQSPKPISAILKARLIKL